MHFDRKHLSHNGVSATSILSQEAPPEQIWKSARYALKHASDSLTRALASEDALDFTYADGQFSLLIKTYYPCGFIDILRKQAHRAFEGCPWSIPLLSSSFAFGVIDSYERPHLIALPLRARNEWKTQAFMLDKSRQYDSSLFWQYGAFLGRDAQHDRDSPKKEAHSIITQTLGDILALKRDKEYMQDVCFCSIHS